MKFFRRCLPPPPPPPSREAALRCVPVINSSVSWAESTTSETILLEYPLQVRPFLLALFRRGQHSQSVPTRKLQLDEMGSLVWRGIDGHRDVRGIILLFAENYRITQQEAEKSVTAFLAELGRRGIIGMR